MLYILQYKVAFEDNLMLSGNEERLTNHDYFRFWKLALYFKLSFSCPSYYNSFIKSGKIATNADILTNVFSSK